MWTIPIAMSSRRRWPPDNVPAFRLASGVSSSESRRASALVGRFTAGHPVTAALGDDFVADELVVGGAVTLPHVADPLPDSAWLRRHVEARHRRRPRRR